MSEKKPRCEAKARREAKPRCKALSCLFVVLAMATMSALTASDVGAEAEAEAAFLNQDTPHGKLLQTLCLEGTDGADVAIDYFHPGAVFWILMQRLEFMAFMDVYCPFNQVDICWYADDVRPGNVLRPDRGRKYWAFYLTVTQWPQWFRVSAAGWLDLCYFTAKTAKRVRGGVTAITSKLMAACRFPFKVRRWLFRFGCLMSDEAAIKVQLGVVGAGGHKCCACCENIYGYGDGALPEASGTFRRITCSDIRQWKPYTAESFADVVDAVEAAWARSRREGKELERLLGVQWLGGVGILFNKTQRASLRFPETVYWDSTHSLFAAGGIAQYVINGYLRCLHSRGVTYEDMDAFFAKGAQMKSGWPWETALRIRGEGKPVKAFANECVAMIGNCVALCDLMDDANGEAPSRELGEHARCLRILFDVSSLLSLPEQTVRHHVDLLQDLFTQFHSLCMAQYPGTRKPKAHYILHVPGCIRKFGCHINAFSAERRHRSNKTVATRYFKNLAGSLTRHVGYRHLQRYADAEVYNPYALLKVLKKPKIEEKLLTLQGIHVLRRGNEMRTPTVGVVTSLMFVLWASSGCLCGGILRLCGWMLRAVPGAQPEPFVIVDEHALDQRRPTPCAAVFAQHRPRRLKVLHPSALIARPPWFDAGNDKVRVVIPQVFRVVHGV